MQASFHTLLAALALILAIHPSARSAEPTPDDLALAVKTSYQFLASKDRDQRQRLQARLAKYSGDIEPVIKALATEAWPPVKPGYHPDEQFQTPELLEKYPKDWLYFVVPKTYSPAKPTGLIVFMHGGGAHTSRDAAIYTLQFPTADSSDEPNRSGDMFSATGMITVGPSAPGKGESYYRWCLKASEQYLVDVIAECRQRFNIDADRVFLLGHSMGGFGAYHHALRQPDRFAGIIVSSGSWDCGYWPVIRGTPLCIAAGEHDAARDRRWHYTDVEYGRRTHEIFEREKLEHEYHEHQGGHGFAYNRSIVAKYFARSQKVRRDPYYPHVAVATPQGFSPTYLNPVQHNRWLSLDEAASGSLQVDELRSQGEDFDEWKLIHRRTRRRGAALDAVNRGDNLIEVTTLNVARFTIWLHPKMVDVAKPVTIKVDGKTKFSARVTPSLATALESYERRQDWGLIYSAKVEVDLSE
jgi:predicted esterase